MVVDAKGDGGGRGCSMADHVRERLLHDAIGGRADLRRYTIERAVARDRDGKASVAHR